MPSELRQNPFTKAFSWTPLSMRDAVSEFDHLPGLYGIMLNEIPRPGSVVITPTGNPLNRANEPAAVTIVNDDPLPAQARVDYERGHIVFNPIDYGLNITVSFDGGGTILNLANLNRIIQLYLIDEGLL